MRAIVFFDLPTLTSSDRKEFSKFRKYLLKNGFIMMQESVYIKLALNQTVMNTITNNLEKNRPPKGLVQLLVVTEKQFAEMKFLIGSGSSTIINSTEKLVVL